MRRREVIVVVVLAQFCGTSLWFAVNAILPQLQLEFAWPSSTLGFLTSGTQLGFIIGTLIFAITGLADRVSPSKLFFISSSIASAINVIALFDMSSFPLVLTTRLLVGFFLAGIYPVGIKIAADWREDGLGLWLGALVGALVLGTSFPYILKLLPHLTQSQYLLVSVSIVSFLGGLFILFLVPDGPYRKPAASFSFASIRGIFFDRSFRSPALGYFGHMWELYAFYAFVPWIISQYEKNNEVGINHFFLSFLIIGSGAIGCTLGGWLSTFIGSIRVARYALLCSAVCCLFSPLLWSLSPALFVSYLIFWGIVVPADSPQLSSLVASTAPAKIRGSATTFVICIGFSITILSIQLLSGLQDLLPRSYLLLLLAPGPLVGLAALRFPSR